MHVKKRSAILYMTHLTLSDPQFLLTHYYACSAQERKDMQDILRHITYYSSTDSGQLIMNDWQYDHHSSN